MKNIIVSVFVALFCFTVSHASSQNTKVLGTYSDARKFIHQLASQYPKTVEIFQLGLSNSGDMIEGVKIGNGSVNNLVVSTHHGNEFGSTEVAAAFATSIAESPIQGQTLYVIPVLNISGFNKRERREYIGTQTFDPNRDYPGPCGTDGPFNLKSTAALAKFVNEKNIVASATLHTYYPAVVYPWGISTHDLSTLYDDLFKTLVQAATVESHYSTGNSTDVIYPADGTYEDYAFWKHGIWSILFELGHTHNPSQADLDTMVKANVPGLRRMMLQAPLVRADKHDFTGKCDSALQAFDLREE